MTESMTPAAATEVGDELGDLGKGDRPRAQVPRWLASNRGLSLRALAAAAGVIVLTMGSSLSSETPTTHRRRGRAGRHPRRRGGLRPARPAGGLRGCGGEPRGARRSGTSRAVPASAAARRSSPRQRGSLTMGRGQFAWIIS